MEILSLVLGLGVFVYSIGALLCLLLALGAFWRKEWRKALLLLVAPVVGLAVLVGGANVWERVEYQRYLDGLFDARVELGKPIYGYNSERAINGDGYTIWVHELPGDVRRRFEMADAILMSEFPKKPKYRSKWREVTWRQGPLDKELREPVEFALLMTASYRPKEAEPYFAEVLEALRRPTTYYAMFFNGDTQSVTDADLFVIDLEKGRLYVINHNT